MTVTHAPVDARRLVFALLCVVGTGCAQLEPPGPFEQLEDEVWRTVNRSHLGDDGIFVQVTLRSFAYEVASAYAKAEKQELDQEQLESRIRHLIYAFIDGSYPVEDGTDINSLYFQYLVYVNPKFDPTNPIEKSMFDSWRSEYVRRLMGKLYDRKFALLRHHYDQRWGLTLYSRLVFDIYLDNERSDLKPRIDDIGERTFIEDDNGKRYKPSGLAGPYPYEYYRPKEVVLDGNAVYRLFFPNRQEDRKTPIAGPDAAYVDLVIVGLGDEPERRLRWELPLHYPEAPARRLFPPKPAQVETEAFRPAGNS